MAPPLDRKTDPRTRSENSSRGFRVSSWILLGEGQGSDPRNHTKSHQESVVVILCEKNWEHLSCSSPCASSSRLSTRDSFLLQTSRTWRVSSASMEFSALGWEL